MMTRSRETPIRVAVFGSWATARTPRPSLVRLSAMSVSNASTSAAPMMTIVVLEIATPNSSN